MPSLPTKTLLLALFLSLAVLSHAKLTIKTLSEDKTKFSETNGIDYVVLTPQNKITYSRKFVGTAVLASPKENACEKMTAFPSYGDDVIYNPIVVAPWGECHYANKVSMAQTAGAKMLLLVLENEMLLNHPSIRSLPMTSSIEVLAVSKTDGENLIKMLREAKNMTKDDPKSVIELVYSYEPERNVNYVKTEGKVTIDYWIAPVDTNKASYEFLGDLQSIMNDFGGAIKFTPHYVFWQNEALAKDNYSKDDNRCVSGGRYCDPEPQIDKRINGDDAVVEALRQICLRKLSGEITPSGNWWRYVDVFGQYCANANFEENEKCYEKAYSLSYIQDSVIEQVNKCMRDSFEGGAKTSDDLREIKADNTELRFELGIKEEMHVDHYPALFVNRERYTETFRNKAQLVEFICSHFVTETTPKICFANPNIEPTHTSRDTGVYVMIILGSVIFMAIVLYCVRRGVKREVMVRMNDEISHIVTQYKQFKDKSNSSNVDDDL